MQAYVIAYYVVALVLTSLQACFKLTAL